MKKTFLSLAICIFISQVVNAEKRKILFLGNSYTAVNDLPNTLRQLALSFGDTLEVDSYSPGGATFNTLYNDANALAKIQMPGWDYVVLQAQSQEPSFSPAQVQANTYPFAKKLDSLIHISNPCAETIFYMTWGRKNGDAGNCANYPPVCTFEGMQQRLRESYLEMSDDNNATCSPVGVAWRTFRNLYPAVELYNPDESHPSVSGTYLTACVFYSTIYLKSAAGASYVPAGVVAADAVNIQTVAGNTVLDSIENWQQYGSLPFSDFSFNVNVNAVSFTNNSLRAMTYEWDFGDGSPVVNTMNATHTYSLAGNYTVTLQAKSNCNKNTVNSKVVNVQGIPTSMNDLQAEAPENIFYQDKKLFLQGDINRIEVMNLNGSRVLYHNGNTAVPYVDCSFLPAGIYFYRALNAGKNETKGKFTVQ